METANQLDSYLQQTVWFSTEIEKNKHNPKVIKELIHRFNIFQKDFERFLMQVIGTTDVDEIKQLHLESLE